MTDENIIMIGERKSENFSEDNVNENLVDDAIGQIWEEIREVEKGMELLRDLYDSDLFQNQDDLSQFVCQKIFNGLIEIDRITSELRIFLGCHKKNREYFDYLNRNVS